MLTQDFDYYLPQNLIAQQSVEPRDNSRLMILDRQTGKREHKVFHQIIDELVSGDVLVMNNTKVFRARLRTIDGIEVFLVRARSGKVWEVLIRPGRKVKINQTIEISSSKNKKTNLRRSSENSLQSLFGQVLGKHSNGIVLVRFDRAAEDVVVFANEHGEIPVPPYVEHQPDRLEDYQTVYAEHTGSVAAPTAGFHFTKELIEKLKQKGVQFEFVTLHVGLGTFRPMKTETLEEHEMHAEFVSVDKETAQRINQAKQEGCRVIAVGTTTVRTLEGVARICHLELAERSRICEISPLAEPALSERSESNGLGRDDNILRSFTGDVNLFIKPGFDFKVIDGLITNFHLPKSTLLVLVSALAGRENILKAYKEAVEKKYRFYSFGDAMFIR